VEVLLGEVDTPSGVVVLAMGGWVDEWPELGRPLSAQAMEAAARGGGHLHEWLCEAVAAPTVRGRHAVTAQTRPSVADPAFEAIAAVDIGLGLPWQTHSNGQAPKFLGDLPVHRLGMVIGDAVALDSWVGLGSRERSIDGLADVAYDGRDREAVRARFGGEWLRRFRGYGPYGWRDLPVDVAQEHKREIDAWAGDADRRVSASVALHSHFHLADRAGWDHPLGAGVVDVAGCGVLFIGWEAEEYSMSHAGERANGMVYPVTVERKESGEAVLRWTLLPVGGARPGANREPAPPDV
jgi:hypothetical protein